MSAPSSPNPASPAHRGVGRPPAGGEDKRERILTEAVGLFAARGYAGTSLNDIARAAEISKAGLLHHFGSKELLFTEVLDRRDEVTTAQWRDLGSNPWELLDHFVTVVEANQSQETFVRLYTSVSAMGVNPGNPAHDWLRRHFQLGIDNLAARLEQGKSEGTVHPEAPSDEIARLVWAAADGIQAQWLCQRADGPATQPEIDMAEHVRLLADLLRARWELDPARAGQGQPVATTG